MVFLKNIKKTQQQKSNTKSTLSVYHQKHIKKLGNKIKKKQVKINQLGELKLKLAKLESKSEIEPKDLKKKMNIIDNIHKINTSLINNNTDNLDDYLLNSSHLLYSYYDNDHVNASHTYSENKKTVLDFFLKKPNQTIESSTHNNFKKTKISSKKKIMNDYLSSVIKNHVPDINDLKVNTDICRNCNVSNDYNYSKGIIICPSCGIQNRILVDNDTPSYKDPPREITYFAYKKINHANEFLSQFQAKESTDIDNDIFDKIKDEIKKETYLNIANISYTKVREILKKLELTKYYEHCNYITNRLTGKPAPVLDAATEEKLRNMFKEVQGPWLKFCPNDRVNFFSYPYIFYKFFELLDMDEYLEYCRLLKSREKLQEHDQVWKQICKELKWQYIPTA
tara:strand:+ start:3433 stop:4617 length:1185 start_codon:yes stop_codon:yes gene_type:complete